MLYKIIRYFLDNTPNTPEYLKSAGVITSWESDLEEYKAGWDLTQRSYEKFSKEVISDFIIKFKSDVI